MSTPDIKLVLFDVGNVVIRATHAITWAILEDWGLAPEVARRFFANEDYADFARGRLDGNQFAQRLMEVHLRIDFPSYLELRVAHDAHMYDVDRGTIGVLDSLRAREISLAFATDTNPWQTLREAQLVDLRKYGRVFRSHDLGALKADGGVFERILAELGEEPSRVLFVDDSPEKVERAAALGMVTHRFTSAATLRQELTRFGLLH